MKIKRIFLSAVLGLSLLFSFAGCNANNNGTPANGKTIKLEAIDPDMPITLKGTILQQYMINHDIPQSDPNGYLLADFDGIKELEFFISINPRFGGIYIDQENYYPITNDDVYDLRYCTNLKSLKIGNMASLDEDSNIGVTDLSSLAYLPNLQTLYISKIGNADISVINNLKRLENVNIYNSNIDFSKLENTNLRKIEVTRSDCKITDFYKQFDTASEDKSFTLLATDCPNIKYNQFEEAREKYPDDNIIKFKK